MIALTLALLAQDTGMYGGPKDGIVWEKSFDAATGKGKPVMLMHLLGRLDEEFC